MKFIKKKNHRNNSKKFKIKIKITIKNLKTKVVDFVKYKQKNLINKKTLYLKLYQPHRVKYRVPRRQSTVFVTYAYTQLKIDTS